MGYSKPQSPLQINGEYVYPLTTYDQIINSDGSRGYDVLKKTAFLYSATLKLDAWLGTDSFSQTVSISSTETDIETASSSIICSPAMVKQTGSLTTNNVLSYNLGIINNGNIVIGQSIITVTVFTKPSSDIEIYLLIKEGGN